VAARKKRRRSRAAKAPGRYHHGDLHRALIEASIDLIDEEGVSALTLRGVARRLGVSHAAPRHHFADKNELLAAVAIEGFETLTVELREASTGIAEPWKRFKALGVGYIRFAVAHPSHFRVMFGRELAESRPPALVEYLNPASQLLLDAAVEAMSSSGLGDEERVRIAAISAWSIVHGLVMLRLDGPLHDLIGIETDAEFDRIARAVTDFVVDSVARGL
jgi:AcrR family transcriptional regulator